jgi:hypothetical protein
MAVDDDIPLGGFQVPNGRKARTFSREDSIGRSAADNDFGPLELDAGPERLPWLESDDDAFELEKPASSRLLGFALLGLVGLLALVGGIWWATHRQPSDKLLADGSTVAAPNQPYKILPNEPGGKTFDGTGDSAFVVSEGQSRPAKLGEPSSAVPTAMASASPGAASPAGGVATKPTAATPLAVTKPSWPTPPENIKPLAPAAKAPVAAVAKAPTAPAAAAATAAVSRGPVVQVGAYSTRAAAEAGWSKLMGRSAALSGQRHQIVEGQADFGRVYRLQVVSGDSGSANALCGKLKSSGIACQVKN